jgi:hypothetical protein
VVEIKLHDGLKMLQKIHYKVTIWFLICQWCAWFWFVLIFYLSFSDLEGIVHFRFSYLNAQEVCLCIELLVHSK